MTRKDDPPVFVPRKPMSLVEMLRAAARSKRPAGGQPLLVSNLAEMRARAEYALEAPDQYNTHQPARAILGRLSSLEDFAKQPKRIRADYALLLLNEMASTVQDFGILNANTLLSPVVNQVRRRNANRRLKAKSSERKVDPVFVESVLSRGLTAKQEAIATGYSLGRIKQLRAERNSKK